MMAIQFCFVSVYRALLLLSIDFRRFDSFVLQKIER